MKRLISILLVAMLIIGMFPATVFAADDTTITFNLGANGSASHADGSEKTSYTETVDGYTLTLSSASKMYTGARDAKGNSCIKLGTSSAAGKFSFTVPDDVTSVMIAVAKYKTNTSKVTINGTTTTLTKASNNGEYDVITVDTSSTKTVSLTTASGGYRAMVNTITYIVPTAAGACEHESKTSLGDGYAATCTEPGKEDTYKCDNPDCGKEFPGEEIAPLGHNYVDGICNREGCGAEEPDGYVLTDIANIKEGDIVIITMAKSGNVYAMSNDKGTSSAPAATKVTVENDTIAEATDSILWNVGGSAGAYVFYPNGSTATWLYCTNTNNGVRIGTNSNKTFKIDAPTGYLVNNGTSRYIGVYNSADWRCYATVNNNITGQTLAFYVQSAGDSGCEECVPGTPVKEKEVAPTCTKEGSYESVTYCAECGNVIARETVTVPMINHVYENGACTSCSKVDPSVETKAELMTAVPGNGDKIIIYNPSSKTAMGVGDADSDSKLDSVSTEPADTLLPYNTAVAVLTVETDGDYFAFKLNNGTYLATDSDGGQLTFEATASDLTLWSIASVGDLWTITSKSATNSYGAQALEYYSGEYTTYAGSGDAFNMALYLVEKGENACTHENTTEQSDGYAATCTAPGKTNSWTCDACGATVTAQQDIPAQGHHYVDGFCDREGCGAKEPQRYYIAAYRNSESTYYYMTGDLGTASTKRYQAVATNILPSNIDPDEAVSNYVFILTDNGDGTCYLQAEGAEGNNYLGWTSGNSGILVAKENAKLLTLSDSTKVEGAYNIHFTGDEERYLSLNEVKDSNYFAWYKGTQSQDLILIPVEAAETTSATLYGDVENITADGDLYLDLNGHNATNITADKIYAYDSTATTSAKGTGKLVTESAVEIDNTVNGKRYIALKGDENTYTFHVLELKLTTISLRTANAGIYYQAMIFCDAELSDATASYGVALSDDYMPGTDFADDDNVKWTDITGAPTSGVAFTSGSVFNIFKDLEDLEGEAEIQENRKRGETLIYANAYLKLNDEAGTILMTDNSTGDVKDDSNPEFNGIALSLKQVMAYLNTNYATMGDKQTQIAEFYKQWADVMSTWDLTTIAEAAAQLA